MGATEPGFRLGADCIRGVGLYQRELYRFRPIEKRNAVIREERRHRPAYISEGDGEPAVFHSES